MLTAMITSAQSLRAWSIGRLSDDGAVDEQSPVDLYRRHGPGHRHARAHRLRQAAAAERDFLTRLDVGGDRTERYRKLTKVGDAECGSHHGAEFRLDRDPGEYTLGQRQPAIADAVLGREQRLVVVDLAADRDFSARGLVPEDLLPVGREDELLHLRRRPPRRERRPDDCSHARSRHARDRHAQFLEYLEHAHMRNSACPATRQCEADARTRRWRRDRCRLRLQPGAISCQDSKHRRNREGPAGDSRVGIHRFRLRRGARPLWEFQEVPKHRAGVQIVLRL